MSSSPVPPSRITVATDRAIRSDGDFVLYWMTAARRASSNFALDHAIASARSLGKPLVVLEALRVAYPWASDRLHRFVLEGMACNQAAFAEADVRYYPYVEPRPGDGSGLLEALAERACLVVGDEFPCFFLPRMVAAVAGRLETRFELVDSNGIVPLRAPGERVFSRAVDFRRWVQNNIEPFLDERPALRPLARLELPRARLPKDITSRWPEASAAMLRGDAAALADLPIDHDVAPVHGMTGGAEAARDRLRAFLRASYDDYDANRNHPDRDGSSGLSPWLHFGHISSHEIFAKIAAREEWRPERLGARSNGSREGFWNMSVNAEAYIDQIVTWRELGYNMTLRRSDYDQFESLPGWAQQTLQEHTRDPRSHLYTFEELDAARTHDDIWNAAQRQLRREGRIHNYLRMLWGKNVLAWSQTPQEALQILIELNNRYALDGRNPNSYSGIFWVFGRYDRAWGPERPVFGKIRYMTSDSTRRKLRLKEYLAEFGAESRAGRLFAE